MGQLLTNVKLKDPKYRGKVEKLIGKFDCPVYNYRKPLHKIEPPKGDSPLDDNLDTIQEKKVQVNQNNNDPNTVQRQVSNPFDEIHD